MLSKKKRKALIVVSIASVMLVCLILITAGYFAIPIFIALFFVSVGMMYKWIDEWIITNFDKLKVEEKAQIVKEEKNEL